MAPLGWRRNGSIRVAINKGRQEGEGLIKRDKQPIHFKSKKKAISKDKYNKIREEKTAKKSEPLKI